MPSCAPAAYGVTPGLGFLHLPPGASAGRRLAAKGIGAGARGAPRGESSASASECCSLCGGRSECRAWFYRGGDGKCFLGNCTDDGFPCLERLGTRRGAAAGVGSGAPVLLCTHPDGAKAAKGSGGLKRRTAERAGGRRLLERRRFAGSAGRFALLLMGHRNRLMFETLPAAVVTPTVAAGYAVDIFGYLENSTMAKVREES